MIETRLASLMHTGDVDLVHALVTEAIMNT